MAEFGKIDDPVDASFEAWPAETNNLSEKLTGLALSFGGLEFGPAKIAKILKDQFFTQNRFARIEYLFRAIRLQLKILESRIGNAQDQVRTVQQRLEVPQFSEAIATACEEAARATNAKKIEQFASVLVGSLTPNQWVDPGEGIGVMIRDIAQLGEKDIKVLNILSSVHASVIATSPNFNEPDAFSRETATLMREVRSSGVHPDDFLSTCERLRGFGLAAEVLRNTSHMAPHDYCYRPTRRGLAVLSYLIAAPDCNAPGAGAK
jgi:hypothetical protein